jgi:hypothetical protein
MCRVYMQSHKGFMVVISVIITIKFRERRNLLPMTTLICLLATISYI